MESLSNSKLQVIAFIHAKGNSSRIPKKNCKPLGDKPLFCHAIANALKANNVTEVVIDSDCDEILRIGAEYGAIPLKRDTALASNETTGDELAFWQASNYASSDIVLQVIPTSPFIKSESIDKAVETLLKKKVDSVVGVFKETLYQWKNDRPAYYDSRGRIPNSFELEPVIYETTGLYVNRTEFVLKLRKRINLDSCGLFFLSRIEAIDINYPDDFELAEIIWKGLHS